jgi:hypothetical protein
LANTAAVSVISRVLPAALLCGSAVTAVAQPHGHGSHESASEPSLRIGGYAQPQIKVRQNDDVAQFDEDGFRLRRARLTLEGTRPPARGEGVEFGFQLEAELTPVFTLLDAFVSARGELMAGGAWQVDLGQVKAPFSRQTLVSDARLQLPEKALLTAFAPDRQLGLRASIDVPWVPMVELSGGVFNGEGRNQLENIDEELLYVGRLAVRPIGPRAPLIEGAFGPDAVAVAVSAARNVATTGAFEETITLLGGDVFASWNGISGTVEYLWRRSDFPDGATQLDFRSEGLNAQLGYLLPIPGYLDRKLEVAARYEEADARGPSADFPIEGPGDPNQSVRNYQLGLSYYHAEHALKAQLSLSHNTEVETRDRNDADATYDNDTLLLQVTYVLE